MLIAFFDDEKGEKMKGEKIDTPSSLASRLTISFFVFWEKKASFHFSSTNLVPSHPRERTDTPAMPPLDKYPLERGTRGRRR